MRRDDILLNELYSGINNKQLNEGIFNTAKQKLNSYLKKYEKKELMDSINDLKLSLMQLGYDPKEFLNYDKLKMLDGESSNSTTPTSNLTPVPDNNPNPTSTPASTPTSTSTPESTPATTPNHTPQNRAPSSTPKSSIVPTKKIASSVTKKSSPAFIPDLDEYYKNKEEEDRIKNLEKKLEYSKKAAANQTPSPQRLYARVFLNKYARDNNQPIPYPSIIPKPKTESPQDKISNPIKKPKSSISKSNPNKKPTAVKKPNKK